jgi:hypothetical protein
LWRVDSTRDIVLNVSSFVYFIRVIKRIKRFVYFIRVIKRIKRFVIKKKIFDRKLSNFFFKTLNTKNNSKIIEKSVILASMISEICRLVNQSTDFAALIIQIPYVFCSSRIRMQQRSLEKVPFQEFIYISIIN